MQWIRVTLLLICVAFAQAGNTEKPSHGVSLQVTISVVSAQTACVFVFQSSEQPIQLRSAQWLQGDWIDDASVDCRALQQDFIFVAQIPAEQAYQPVSVQLSWQLGSDIFSGIYSGSANPDAQSRQAQSKVVVPAADPDPDSLFIIRIGQ
ncbi:MAG: hypothetical protein P8X79_04020 [Reinekea sp.]